MVGLGHTVVDRREVRLDPQGRRQGTYVLGLNGTGKTTLLLNLAVADMQAGDGLCVLDPHGDLIEDLLARVPPEREADVVLFDPSDIERPFGLNLFECADPADPIAVDLVCSEVVGTFYKLFYYSWGPQMEDLLRNTALTLIANPGSTLADIPRLLTDRDYRSRFTHELINQDVADFWAYTYDPLKTADQLAYNRSTLNKVRRFLLNTLIRNIVGQPTSSLDFRAVMDERRILLVNLSKGRLGEENASLLGSILVGQLLIAALSRATTVREERVPFHLIVDEYHSFATQSFPTLQAEARKYAIDTVVAHQYRDQLDELNRGSTLNVGNVICYRVSGKDSSELATVFDNTPPEPELERQPVLYPTGREGVFRTGERGEHVLAPGKRRLYADVAAERANHLANLPNHRGVCRLVKDNRLVEQEFWGLGPQGKPDPVRAERIRARSRECYGRDRQGVEESLKRRGALSLPVRSRYD